MQNKSFAQPYFLSAVHILVTAYGTVKKCQVFKKRFEGVVEWERKQISLSRLQGAAGWAVTIAPPAKKYLLNKKKIQYSI